MSRRRSAEGSAVCAALALALGLALGACGIPVQNHPRSVRDGDVPFDLLNPSPPVPPTSVAIELETTVTTAR